MEELNNQQPQQQVGNGWTTYQKLVLSEISRHDDEISILKEGEVTFKIFSSQINQKFDSLMEKIAEIRENQVAIKKYVDGQDEKFKEQKLELEHIKWKVATVLVIFTFLINAGFQAFFKFWKA